MLQAYLVLLCFTLLYFADIVFYTNWSFVATLCLANLLAPFFQQFAHCMSPCHILVILAIFLNFCICYGDLWSVIFDVTIVTVWGGVPQARTISTNMCILTASPTSHCPNSLPLLGSPIPWSTTVLKLGQLIPSSGL